MPPDPLRPETEAELSAMIAAATGPLRVTGGGTRGLSAGGAGAPGRVLSTAALAGVRLYEPGALTLVAGAGTEVAEVERLLAAEGQRLAFEVPDLRALLGVQGRSTLGGVVAANASGPRRVQAGACRDHLLGVRFVDGGGNIVANGGRVMKNVTGYDLARLIAGSRGVLGVLTEVALKVLPRPEAEATLRIVTADAGQAVAARAVAALSAALGSPFDVTGAAYWPGQGAFVRVEGFAGSVAYRAGRLADLLAPFGAVSAAPDGPATWRAIRDVAPLAGVPGDLWCVHLRPSDGAAALARAGADAALADWGGGRLWLRLAPGTDLRARLAGLGGHATRWAAAGSDGIPALPPEPPAVAALTAGLRRTFDPRGRLAGNACAGEGR